MDLSAINSLSALRLNGVNSADTVSLTGALTGETGKTTDGTMFDAFLNTAIDLSLIHI